MRLARLLLAMVYRALRLLRGGGNVLLGRYRFASGPVADAARAGTAGAPASHDAGPGAGADDPNSTHFGFRQVGLDEKQGLVGEVFSAVAPKYDLMNDLMSGGMHRLWKDWLVRQLRPAPGQVHLDVAGGTGDVAFRVLRSLRTAERVAAAQGRPAPAQGPGVVIVSDISAAMLSEGRKRADKAGYTSLDAALDEHNMPRLGADLSWLEANAEQLPLADASVDSYTIAFGLRNVTRPEVALAEAARVLRRGGRLLIMEFSTVAFTPLQTAYDTYSFYAIPALGKLVTGDAGPYQYLVESIRQFPPQEELADMMRVAGLTEVRFDNILGGIVAIHSGFKL